MNTRLRLLVILAFIYTVGAVCFGLPKSNLLSNVFFDLLCKQSHKISEMENIKEGHADDVALIVIDQVTLDRLNKQWPWERSVMADFVNRIKKVSPKVVVLDFLFLGASSNPEHDEKFRVSLTGSTPIVLGILINKDWTVSVPNKIFSDISGVRAGIINVPEDQDGVLRRYRLALFDSQDRRFYPTLSFAAVAAAYGVKKDTPIYARKSNVVLGDQSFPVHSQDLMRFYNFASQQKIQQIPFWKIMEDDTLLENMRGKIVFLGVEADILKDNFRIPTGLSSGVRLHAEAVNSILKNDYIRELSPIVNAICFMGVSLVIAVLLTFLNRLKAILMVLGVMSALAGAVFFIFWKYTLFINIAYLLFCGLLTLLLYVLKGDISSSIQIEKLRKKSSQDSLTGLLNLVSFKEECEKRIASHRGREDGVLALVIFDIDHFKSINDQYGHDKGNLVIKLFASVLRASVRSRDLVARYGGDEFCVLLFARRPRGVEDFVGRVKENIKTKVESNSKIPRFYTSAGAAFITGQSLLSYDDLFARADNALYQAKNAGRDRLVLFESQPPVQDN